MGRKKVAPVIKPAERMVHEALVPASEAAAPDNVSEVSVTPALLSNALCALPRLY